MPLFHNLASRPRAGITACSLAALLGVSATGLLPVVASARAQAKSAPEQPSAQARQVANWVVGSGDHGQRPFLLVDKPHARVFVFDAQGRLRGGAPVLLGAARGDHSVPGIGQRPIADIQPHERTTPAGRFIAEPGMNAKGEDIVWIDYDAAVSMHRVRATRAEERRLQRLASHTPRDNRISYGCINVPAAFFDRFVKPTVAAGSIVVYVLPDTQPLHQVFTLTQPALTTAARR